MQVRRTARSVRKNRNHLNFEPLEPRSLLTFAPGTAAAASNPTFDSIIHASQLRNTYDVDGRGLAAAVIDTGIDYLNPALGGSFGPNRKVIGGYDLAMNDNDPRAETWAHGTNVAGLIASESTEAPGVAPGASLVALRVFGNDNLGDFDTIANALQWVVDHHDEYGITVVNLSVSDGGNYTRDGYSKDGQIGQRIAGLIDQLAQLRIPVVAAAGNSFRGAQGMGFIAILPGTVSVTAARSNDELLPDAQRLGSATGGVSATDLVAPGDSLKTTGENGGLTQVTGTSFSAPVVTGSIVLLQQIYKTRFGSLPPVADVLRWLTQGAETIRDQATGTTLSRLDLTKAAALIPTPQTTEPPQHVETPPQQTPQPTPTPSPTPNPNPDTPPAPTFFLSIPSTDQSPKQTILNAFRRGRNTERPSPPQRRLAAHRFARFHKAASTRR